MNNLYLRQLIAGVCVLLSIGNIEKCLAQTTLSSGDLSIVGFNPSSFGTTGSPQGFAFVCWVDIANNTVIKFTENTFNSSGSASNASSNANTSNQNIIYWENNTGSTISAGKIIKLENTTGGNAFSASTGTILGYGTAGNGSAAGTTFAMNNGGRCIFAYQYSGTDDFSASASATATYNGASGSILFGLTYYGSGTGSNTFLSSGSSSSGKSYLPSDLSSSYTVSGLGATSTTSVRAGYYSGSLSGFATVAAAKSAVNNASNWTTSSTNTYVGYPASDFTLPSSNTAPTFTNSSPQSLTVCQNTSATSINSLLTVSDVDASQTETWSVTTSPSHGTLGGFNATASSGSTAITPTGLTYTPTNGYSGSDQFILQVSDGTATASMTVNVTVNGLPTITLGSNPSVCNGVTSTNLTYSATTNSPDKYNIAWSAGGIIAGFSNVNGYTSSLPSSPISLTVPSNPGAGSYTGTITVKNSTTGCISTGNTMGVTVNALPTITLGSNPSVCNGTTAANLTYSATTSSPNQYSIAWSAGGIIAGFSNVSTTSLPSSPISLTVPSNPGSGSYTGTITVKNSTTGCSSTGNTMGVTVNALPTITLGSNPSVCNGTTAASLTYSATTSSPNQYSIAWSAGGIIAGFSNVSTTSLPSSPISLMVPNNPGAGSYTGTITVQNSTTGCSSTGSTMSVTVNAIPTITLGSNPSVCSGSTSANLPYSATTGSPTTYGIVWSAAANTAGFTDVTSSPSLPATPIALTVPGAAASAAYSGTLTVSNGTCSSVGIAFTVTINALPTITLGSNPAVCTGSTSANLTYSATTQTPTTYGITWSAAATTAGFTNVSSGTSLPASPITLTVPGAGTPATYSGTITVTNANSCSSTGTAFSTTIQSNPSISVNPIDHIICAGASTTTFTVTAAGTGITYQWQVSTDGGSTYNNLTNTGIYTGTTTATLTLTQATVAKTGYMYHVVVTGTCGSPATSTAATLTVTAPPTITSVSPMTAGPTATVTITGTGFNTTSSNDIVFFGSTKATVNTASTTSLSVSAPNGGTYDRISISNLGCKLMGFQQYSFLPNFTGSSTTPSFAAYNNTTAGTNPFDIATADFDGDGKPDIAVTNGQGGNWTVFRNTSTTGSITYANGSTYTEGPSGQSIYGITVGDLNRDGKPDVVVADRDSSKIDVYINTSSGAGSITFATRVKYSVTHPWQVRVADLDGDGRPEIIVAGDDQQKFSYFRNIYNGTSAFNSTSFATKVDVSVPSSQFLDAIAIGDIDGDGKLDVVVGAQTTNVDNLQVFRNTSSGPGSISFASAVTSASAQYIYYIAIGDLDGDSKADIVAGNNGASYVTVLPNNSTVGSIAFGTPQQLACNGGGYGVCLADFTGHGKPDIAYSNSDGSSTNMISVYRNTSTSGNISFSSNTDFASASSQVWGLVGVDMDGDGKPDIMAPNYQSTNFASYLNTMSNGATYYTWNGSTSTDFNLAANWTPSHSPTSSDSLVIPSGTPNAPDLNNTTLTVNDVTQNVGQTLDLGTGNINVTGDLINNGTITGTGKVILNGTASQNISGTGTVANLELDNSNGATIGTSDSLNVTGLLTLTSGILTTNDNLVLKSTSPTATAEVGPVLGSITGNVTHERYLSAPSNGSGGRSWRLITAPLKGSTNNSIFYNWQNNGVNNGTGIELWSPSGTGVAGNGLTTGGTSPSIYKYNAATNAYVAITNTTTEPLFDATGNKAFLAFVSGSYGSGLITGGATATNANAGGTLITGTQDYAFTPTSASNNLQLIGNPYNCPIDFDKVYGHSTNISRKFWVIDPSLNNIGGYVVVSWNGSSYDVVPSSAQNQYIQTGQAFFVAAPTVAAANVEIQESDKETAAAQTAMFRTNGGNLETFRINLNKTVNGTMTMIDGALFNCHQNLSNTIGAEDATKFGNFNEAISILEGTTKLAIDGRQLFDNGDSIHIAMSNMQQTNYQLELQPGSIIAPGLTATLYDNFLSTSTPVSLTSNTVYLFTVTSSSASSSNNRFKILFNGGNPLAIKFLNVNAQKEASHVNITWTVADQSGTNYYNVESSTDGKSFSNLGTVNATSQTDYTFTDNTPVDGKNYYRIKAIARSTSGVYSNVVTVNMSSTIATINSYPNPVSGNTIQLNISNLNKGVYMVNLFSTTGQKVLSKEISYAGGSSMINLNIAGLAAGIYQLQLLDNNGQNIATEKLIKQ